jgi:integrase
VLAYVGLPQKQIAQLQPSDLRLADRELIAHPRRKGAGAAGRAIPLSDVAIAALREFAALDAFGTFQNSQLVRTFKLGAKRAGVTLPDDARPYDLRHSFLTEVYRNSGDPFAVSELGLHATLQQTARYTKGALSERATKAIAAVPRFSVVAEVQNPPKRSISVAEKRTPHVRKGQQTRGRKARKSRGRM